MATHAPITSRRALLAAAAAVPAAAAAPVAATPSPDAELIAFAEGFLRFHIEKEARLSRLTNKSPKDWTSEDRALWDSSLAENTGYLDDLAEIVGAEPMTPEGAVAQARVALWHFKYAGPGDDEMLALRVAESVLRMQGVPLPEWAA